MLETLLISAFLMGFLGSSHCVAMCGGIVGVLSQRGHSSCPQLSKSTLAVVLTYNIGRISSYCLIGFLTGALGYVGATVLEAGQAIFVARLLTSIFMLSFGFYLMGWPSFLPFLEKKGQRIWAIMSPYTKGLLPIKSLKQSVLLGFIWGWLPCGLVYSAVALSLSTTQPMYGFLTMLAFGLGTLPALLLMGVASDKLTALKSSKMLRQLAGAIIIMLAVYNGLLIDVFPQMLHAGH